jgi:hypothetical protein
LLTQQTDALGKVTDWEYNNRGWLVHKYDPDPDGTGSLPRPQSTYGYDLTGNLTSMGQPDFIGDMSLQYGYDDAGRRVSEKHTGDVNFKTFDYDNLDRVIKVTDQLSNTTVTPITGAARSCRKIAITRIRRASATRRHRPSRAPGNMIRPGN